MAQYRRVSRIIALQTLTALLIRDKSSLDVDECFEYIKQEFAPELRDKDEFSKSLVTGVLDERAKVDKQITKFAPEWPIEKLSPVERIILEIGVFELLFHADTPLAVIINEWVDIAKEFGDETAGRFINGVLSNVGNSARKKEKTPSS